MLLKSMEVSQEHSAFIFRADKSYRQTDFCLLGLLFGTEMEAVCSSVTLICFYYTARRDGIDWIDLAQDRDQWRALVNTVMNLRVP
jgi:hypothetical protein